MTSQVGTFSEQALHPLPVNRLGPTRPVQTGDRQPKKQIPQGRRVENASVQNDGRRGHGSVTHLEFLSLGRQRFECLLPLLVAELLVFHQVAEPHPPMTADLPRRDSPLIQKLDEKWPR